MLLNQFTKLQTIDGKDLPLPALHLYLKSSLGINGLEYKSEYAFKEVTRLDKEIKKLQNAPKQTVVKTTEVIKPQYQDISDCVRRSEVQGIVESLCSKEEFSKQVADLVESINNVRSEPYGKQVIEDKLSGLKNEVLKYVTDNKPTIVDYSPQIKDIDNKFKDLEAKYTDCINVLNTIPTKDSIVNDIKNLIPIVPDYTKRFQDLSTGIQAVYVYVDKEIKELDDKITQLDKDFKNSPGSVTYVGGVGAGGVTGTGTAGSLTKWATSTNLTDATAGTDYLAPDFTWKQHCRVTASNNISVTSAPATIDGVTMVAGDRVFLWLQTTTSQNGIWIWNGTGVAMTRAPDADTSDKIRGSIVTGDLSSNYAGTTFRNTNTSAITVGTTEISYVRLITAGAGLNQSAGNTLAIPTLMTAGSGGAANNTILYSNNIHGQLTAISATPISISYSQVYDFTTGLELGLDSWYDAKPWKNEVNVAVPFPVDNINDLFGNIVDGVSLDADKTILLYLQNDTSQNGIYYWKDGTYVTRLDWKDKGDPDGTVVTVTEGDLNGGHLFKFTTKGSNRNPNQPADNFVRIETTRDLYKQPVDVATSAVDETDIDINSLLQEGNILNPSSAYPVTLTAGMRVMVKNQTNGGSNANLNGIYIVPDHHYSTNVVRASDFYTDQDVQNVIVPVKGGEYRGTVWQVQAAAAETSVIVDSNNVWFTEIARIGYGGEKKVIPTNGSYTPSIVSSNNIDTSSASEAQWSRIGDLIIVSGELTATPTTTASGTYVELSLPVDTNMGGSTFLLAGTAASGDLKPSAAKVYGGSNSAFIFWDAQVADEYTWSYIYQYKLNQP